MGLPLHVSLFLWNRGGLVNGLWANNSTQVSNFKLQTFPRLSIRISQALFSAGKIVLLFLLLSPLQLLAAGHHAPQGRGGVQEHTEEALLQKCSEPCSACSTVRCSAVQFLPNHPTSPAPKKLAQQRWQSLAVKFMQGHS